MLASAIAAHLPFAGGSIKAQQAAGGGMGMLILPVALIAIMYFAMIRPQKKREKEQQNKLSTLQVGDTIMTIGGILGKVVNITGDQVTISTSVANTMMAFRKDAVSEILKPEELEALISKKPVATAEQTEKKGIFGFGRKKDK